jgi:hypothetical protein
MQKITLPSKTLAEGFDYTPSNRTNVQCTWRKFGWVPLTELVAQEEAKQTVKRARTSKEVSHA